MHNSAHHGTRLCVSIVLHQNPLTDLRDTLTSLAAAAQFAHEEQLLDQLQVYLVDNASGDTYRTELRRLAQAWPEQSWSRLTLLAQSDNRGFGAGHNVALAQAGAYDAYLILNPDVVISPNALAVGLGRLAQEPHTALLSPRVVGPGGRREYLCKAYPSVWVLLLRGFAPASIKRRFEQTLSAYELHLVSDGDRDAQVPIASGCCMLVRTSVLQAVGGFDEGYFLYFEDFDLSLRMSKHGQLVFCPDMQIEHRGGYAARKGGKHLAWFVRSGVRFFNRHGWRWL